MTLNTINLINEKDNVSAKVRSGVKTQVMDKVIGALSTADLSPEKNANGGISFPIAIDRKTGDTVYVHLDFVLNTTDPTVKKERKSSTKKAKAEVTEEEIIPQIFEG